jgi:large subunit ribosomal protein L13
MHTDTSYIIDASQKRLGRVAADVARVLMGKHAPTYERHRITGPRVRVTNAARLQIDERRKKNTLYYRHSGYLGSLKSETLADVIRKKGHGEGLRRAVYGMLPKNKLRPRMMKRLEIN